jgi:hypothetical protein
MAKVEISRASISVIKMSVNPPVEVVNAGNKCISNGKVYHYVGIYWVEEREATVDDEKSGIPVLID